MNLQYKKRYLNINLIFGIVWLAYFINLSVTVDVMEWKHYGWLVISLAYLTQYIYHRYYTYVTISNGVIKVNSPFGKRMNLTDITTIKTFAGDYILKTNNNNTTLKINTQILAPNALAKLNAELQKLNVEWV